MTVPVIELSGVGRRYDSGPPALDGVVAREIAVRRALGARVADIMRQLVVEALAIAAAAGALGLGLAIVKRIMQVKESCMPAPRKERWPSADSSMGRPLRWKYSSSRSM